MRIPATMQGIVKQLGLRTWVGAKDFPLEKYFRTIDGGLALLADHQDPDADFESAQVVPVIAAALDAEGALMTHALANGLVIESDTHWFEVCKAAAWVILQRYTLAVRKEEWPPHE